MVIQILFGIHPEQLFFSFKEKPSLSGIWTQERFNSFYQAPALPSEPSCYSLLAVLNIK